MKSKVITVILSISTVFWAENVLACYKDKPKIMLHTAMNIDERNDKSHISAIDLKMKKSVPAKHGKSRMITMKSKNISFMPNLKINRDCLFIGQDDDTEFNPFNSPKKSLSFIGVEWQKKRKFNFD